MLRRRIKHLLRRGTPPSDVDCALFDAYVDLDPAMLFSEADVLSAFNAHGWSVWLVVGVFLNGFQSRRLRPFFLTDIDAWVDFVSAIGRACADSTAMEQAAAFVAKNLTRQARNRILARANDPHDPQSTFILLEIVRRMQTATTDDLTAEASKRLLCSFLSAEYKGDPLPNPGSIATEQFIRELVLPYARKHGKPEVMQDIDSILFEAGARHGMKYYLES